jgi:formylglycine-generating enzyme required for sulfatase activity
MMGSDDGRFDEKPAHLVTITKPFYMSIYETTQEVWEKIMGKNPSVFKGLKRPVESVTWNEAQEFCRKLSALEGVHYRLPTEAEWEFVCRAGTLTPYFWGESFDGAYAWCWFNSDGQTRPVGLKNPNPWGIYDIIGNVVEWCEDGFALYRPGDAIDPVILTGTTRALRGGGWDSHPEICRSSFRLHLSPSDRSDSIGFRIVREK